MKAVILDPVKHLCIELSNVERAFSKITDILNHS